MAPTIADGSYLVLHRWCRLRPGAIVYIKHPIYGDIVKRVATLIYPDQLTLHGDNASSVSEFSMGLCQTQWIVGHVIHIISPV